MSLISKTLVYAASATTLLSMGISNAHAQGGIIENIVVTARKSEESMQSVPVAVTAMNAEMLQAAQIVTLTDLVRRAPTLSMTTGGPGGPGVANLGIRGQASVGGNSTMDTAIGTYLDGVYFARQTSGNLAIFDIGQVEILRGPQGTLFGRNTTGGALSMFSVQPDDEFGGYARAEYGNYNAIQTDGAVTIPLNDELSMRLAGRYASRDGYYDNPILDEDVNDLKHFWGVRATVKWAPNDSPLTVTVAADASDWEDNGQAFATILQNSAVLPPGYQAYSVGPGGTGKWDETYQNYRPDLGRNQNTKGYDGGENAGVVATVDLDMEDWVLKSITSWRKANAANSIDLDNSPTLNHGTMSNYSQDQYSQELQASTTIDKLDLQIGMLYYFEEGAERSVSASAASPSGFTADIGDFDSESRSLYAQGNFHVTEKFRATLGYRYTWDERNLDRMGRRDYYNPTACAPNIPLTPSGCLRSFSADFEYPAWLLGVDYQLSDAAFLYAKVSKASLSGGFNTRETALEFVAFNPTSRQEVEVGAKLDLLDRRLRANVAVFTGDTDGVQQQASGLRQDGTPTQFTTNAGDVESSGVELELTAVPWDGMEMNIGVAYLDSEFSKFEEVRAGGVVVDRSGELVLLAPEWSYNIGFTQEFELSMGTLSAHIDYSYFDEKAVGQSTPTPGAPPAAVAVTQIINDGGILPSYELINGSVSLRMPNGVAVSLWGRNLADEEYYTFSFNALYPVPGFGAITVPQAPPRTFGVSIGYDF